MRYLFILVLLTGCATMALDDSHTYTEVDLPAMNDRVDEWLSRNLIDPNSIIGYQQAGPFYSQNTDYMFICARYNSRNRMGGYGGTETRLFVFFDQKVVNSYECERGCLGAGPMPFECQGVRDNQFQDRSPANILVN